jgi:hypothetical protein
VSSSWILSNIFIELFCPECQFSSTATHRLQNHNRFRPRDKKLTLSPVEGCIRFHRRLLFLFASSSIKTTIPGVQVCGCKIILGQLEWRNFFTPIHQHALASPFLLTCYILFSLANQIRLSSFWFLLLPSPLTVSSCHSSYSYSDMQIGGLSSVRALCRRCSDVTTAYPVLGANQITAVS